MRNNAVDRSTLTPTFAWRSVTTPARGARTATPAVTSGADAERANLIRAGAEQHEPGAGCLHVGRVCDVLGTHPLQFLGARRTNLGQALGPSQPLMRRLELRTHREVPGLHLREFGTEHLGEQLSAGHLLAERHGHPRDSPGDEGRDDHGLIGVRLDDRRQAQHANPGALLHRREHDSGPSHGLVRQGDHDV